MNSNQRSINQNYRYYFRFNFLLYNVNEHSSRSFDYYVLQYLLKRWILVQNTDANHPVKSIVWEPFFNFPHMASIVTNTIFSTHSGDSICSGFRLSTLRNIERLQTNRSIAAFFLFTGGNILKTCLEKANSLVTNDSSREREWYIFVGRFVLVSSCNYCSLTEALLINGSGNRSSKRGPKL